MNKIASFIFLSLVSVSNITAAALPFQISGKSVIDDKQIQTGSLAKKGLVVAFLSAVCPCSNSHLVELKKLKEDFPDFEFVGVHSNTDEDRQLTSSYFKTVNLPFPVVQDTGAKLANELKALKTPHVFVILEGGKTVYEGGVSSSRHFDDKKGRKYLREALIDLSAGRKVKTPEGRTLGCVISRGGKYVW